MEKENGHLPPPPGAEKAINAEILVRYTFRARRAAETWLNNTWFGKILSPTTMDETGEAAKTVAGSHKAHTSLMPLLGSKDNGALSPEHED